MFASRADLMKPFRQRCDVAGDNAALCEEEAAAVLRLSNDP
jgi:hypothetical protein